MMLNNRPKNQLKISVVMPLYNKAAFVKEALESIFLQTHPVYEIIVVDDGSTDDSVACVKLLNHPSIRLIQQSNAGVSVARNTGIRAATGDFIAFLDADDMYRPGFFAAIVRLAQDFPEASLLTTAYCRFSGVESKVYALPPTKLEVERGYVRDFYSQWCRSSFFSTISIAIRASALHESSIRFPAGERLGEDQDVWFQLAERYSLAFDPEVQSEYRVDVAGSATNAAKVIEILPCYQRLADRLVRGEVPRPLVKGARRLLSSHFLNLARARLSSGDNKGAWRLVLNSKALANTIYFMRTSLLIAVTSLGLGVTK